MKSQINRLFQTVGLDVRGYPNRLFKNRMALLNTHNIDVILDVGANVGQYGKLTRELGFTGQIISFEPLKKAFAELKEVSSSDSIWDVHNFGLGNEQTELEINIANNSASSSLLPMNKTHLETAPEIYYSDKETIKISTVDNFLKNNNTLESKNILALYGIVWVRYEI